MSTSLTRDTLVYGTAVMTERAVSFLLLPVLTKTLAPDLFGVWSQIIVTVGLLSSLLLLHLHTALVNTFSGEGKEFGEKYLTFHGVLFVVLVLSACVIGGLWLGSLPVSLIVFGNEEFHVFIPLLGFLLATEALFELTIAFLRSAQQITRLSLYYTVKNVGRLVLMVLGLGVFHVDLYSAILWVVLWQALFISFIYGNDVFARSTPLVLSKVLDRVKPLVPFSLPLVPLGIMLWGNSYLDRYLILHFLGLDQVGVYAVTYSLAATTSVFYSVLGFTLYPELAKLWNGGDRARIGELVKTGMSYYLLFLLPAIALLTILGENIITVFATKRYLSPWPVMLMIAMGIGLYGLYQIYLYIVLLGNKMAQNLFAVLGAMVLNLVLNLVFLRILGLVGAALAIMVSNGFLAGWTITISRTAAPSKFPWRQLSKMIIATIVMSGFLLLAKYYLPLNTVWTLPTAMVIAGGLYMACYCLIDREMARSMRRLTLAWIALPQGR